MKNKFKARLIAWYNEEEDWELLKSSLYSKNIDEIELAIKKLQLYKALKPYLLPHAIDMTACLREAQIFDYNHTNYAFNTNMEKNLPTTGKVSNSSISLTTSNIIKHNYSIILIRFVNGLLDPIQKSKFAIPLLQLAAELKLPTWFVELRHQSTHERNLPSLEILRFACEKSIFWLWNNYWNTVPGQKVGNLVSALDDGDDDDYDDDDDDDSDGDKAMENEWNQKFREIVNLYKDIYPWLNNIENKKYWDANFSKGIKQSKFTDISDGKSDNNRSTDKIVDLKLNKLDQLIRNIRHLWNKYTNKRPTFIELLFSELLDENDDILLQICYQKLNNFDVYYFDGIMNYSNNNDDTCNKFINMVDCEKFINQYNKTWRSKVQNSAYCIKNDIALMLFENIKERLPRNMVRNYQRKSRGNDKNYRFTNYINFVGDLDSYRVETNTESSTLIEKKRTSDEMEDKEKVVEEVQSSQVEKKLDSVENILADINKLKKQKVELRDDRNNSSDIVTTLYRWEPAQDWEPRPIGIL